MGQIILNVLGLFSMILLGFAMKRIGILSKADGSILSKIILNVTLPAAIILNLAQMEVQISALSLIVIAVAITVGQIGIAFMMTRKDSNALQQFAMYCGSGFNIGNFAIPFAQSFYPLGIPLISLFDMGNSIMLAGGTTVLIEYLLKKRTTFEPGKIILNLLRSPTFTVYLVMLVIRSVRWQLPSAFISIVQPIGLANTFLSMFMIGLFLDFRLPKHTTKTVVNILALRYGSAFVLFGLFYLLPLPTLLKPVLCLLVFAPIPLFGVINSVLAGMEEEAVGFVSSASFLISMPLMTMVLILFGLA
ncbi:AEC family transporter [Enterococcus sp. RIT-PI-f]|uniref:AEC family transporter n=1 Tax=Enterococcus sp. RIT-PI-f TaxID=1690244 RepID=UPI0006B98363|nr:AEC family transporter [Enterococcus sp. RIT-PI-f]KPG72972.1 transporter [Enterococcus sp. RIT-PI-f]